MKVLYTNKHTPLAYNTSLHISVALEKSKKRRKLEVKE